MGRKATIGAITLATCVCLAVFSSASADATGERSVFEKLGLASPPPEVCSGCTVEAAGVANAAAALLAAEEAYDDAVTAYYDCESNQSYVTDSGDSILVK